MVIEKCLMIHRKLGPGLFEHVYESILSFELSKCPIDIQRQVPLPVVWEGLLIEDSFRADLILDGKLIVELKSVEKCLPVHKKQLLTYLRVSGCKLGLLVNFGSSLLRDGIERVANGL